MEARYPELYGQVPLGTLVKLDEAVRHLRSVYLATSLLAVGLGMLAVLRRPRWPGILALICASCLTILLASAMV